MTVSIKEDEHFLTFKIIVSDDDERAKFVTLEGEDFMGKPLEITNIMVPEIFIQARGHVLHYCLSAIDNSKLKSWKGGFEDEPQE